MKRSADPSGYFAAGEVDEASRDSTSTAHKNLIADHRIDSHVQKLRNSASKKWQLERILNLLKALETVGNPGAFNQLKVCLNI